MHTFQKVLIAVESIFGPVAFLNLIWDDEFKWVCC